MLQRNEVTVARGQEAHSEYTEVFDAEALALKSGLEYACKAEEAAVAKDL